MLKPKTIMVIILLILFSNIVFAGTLILPQNKKSKIKTSNGNKNAILTSSTGTSTAVARSDAPSQIQNNNCEMNDNTLISPKNYQVFQRDSFDEGSIIIKGKIRATSQSTTRINVVLTSTVNSETRSVVFSGDTLRVERNGDFSLILPAKAIYGWYNLKVTTFVGNDFLPQQVFDVKNVGVGEVFITAGQSNSISSGESPQESHELTSLAIMSYGCYEWRHYIDKNQNKAPNAPKGYFGGSPWASFASKLALKLKVPVAITKLGYGGTNTSQWRPDPSFNLSRVDTDYEPTIDQMPNGFLYDRLMLGVSRIGKFRAILWHQGEADVGIESSSIYAENMKKVMDQLNIDTNQNRIPWFVAIASYVPGRETNARAGSCPHALSTNAPKMAIVTAGQQILIDSQNALAGPHTDDLFGSQYRYSTTPGDCIHFSNEGLRIHGERWYDAVFYSGIFPLLPGQTAPVCNLETKTIVIACSAIAGAVSGSDSGVPINFTVNANSSNIITYSEDSCSHIKKYISGCSAPTQ